MKFNFLAKRLLFLGTFLICTRFTFSLFNPFWSEQVKKIVPSFLTHDFINKKIASMSLEEKIAQLLLVNIEGSENFTPIKDFIDGSKNCIVPGGYLFFSYNISDSSSNVKKFTHSIIQAHKNKKSILPYISIDHEGGDVNRIKHISFPDLPSPNYIANNYDLKKAYDVYSKDAKLLKELGININFAPIAEVCTDKNADFLSTRSFGNFDKVTKYGACQINAFNDQGIFSVLKHFPGNSIDDPHISKSILDVSEEYFYNNLLPPFEYLLNFNPEGVLISHVIIPSIDSVSSCFSYKIVTEILRNKLNFKGIIFSDDIYMSALTLKNQSDNNLITDEEVAKTAVKAIKAGINVIMSSKKNYLNLVNQIKLLVLDDEDAKSKIDASVKYILLAKNKLNLFGKFNE